MRVTPVDMTDPFAPRADDDTLNLRDLIYEEAALAEAGVTCEIKDVNWSSPSCSRCKWQGKAAPEDLCWVGRAQEKAITSARDE